MIAVDNAFALWTILVFASAFGMIGERKGWFLGLSGVIITISITAILTTFELIPSAAVDATVRAPIYNFVFECAIPHISSTMNTHFSEIVIINTT